MQAPAFSPAADRNKQVILEALQTVLPPKGSALEIASGTGQHITWFAQHLPAWQWQPTDTHADALHSIAERTAQAGLHNVHPPLKLDVLQRAWLSDSAVFDVVYCANMIHIAPWATCTALMQLSAQHLAPSGRLITYGPYLEDGVETTPGNLAFDQSLRAENPTWGLRRREAVEAEAQRAGLHLTRRLPMPANNLLLIWQRATS